MGHIRDFWGAPGFILSETGRLKGVCSLLIRLRSQKKCTHSERSKDIHREANNYINVYQFSHLRACRCVRFFFAAVFTSQFVKTSCNIREN